MGYDSHLREGPSSIAAEGLHFDRASTWCHSHSWHAIWGATATHGLHPDSFGGSDAALRMPFFRQFLMWNGGVSATKSSIIKTLKKMASFSIFSGGIREMMATDNDKETIVLKSRVGV